MCEKSCSHAVGGGGGHNKFSDSFSMGASGFSHTEGGHRRFPLFKTRGGANIFEEGIEKFQTRDFPILYPPPPCPHSN